MCEMIFSLSWWYFHQNTGSWPYATTGGWGWECTHNASGYNIIKVYNLDSQSGRNSLVPKIYMFLLRDDIIHTNLQKWPQECQALLNTIKSGFQVLSNVLPHNTNSTCKRTHKRLHVTRFNPKQVIRQRYTHAHTQTRAVCTRILAVAWWRLSCATSAIDHMTLNSE